MNSRVIFCVNKRVMNKYLIKLINRNLNSNLHQPNFNFFILQSKWWRWR